MDILLYDCLVLFREMLPWVPGLKVPLPNLPHWLKNDVTFPVTIETNHCPVCDTCTHAHTPLFDL